MATAGGISTWNIVLTSHDRQTAPDAPTPADA